MNLQTDIMHRHHGVVIIDMLVDRRCILLFHLNRCGSPPGGAKSLVPLWFPSWFFVVLGSLLRITMALFFCQGTLAWRDAFG